ncbi:MAG: ribonuclease PH [Bdellovibrionales bacterium]|nr:ribonuclease PH [Bdellovibrionales bacterium]
MRTSQRALNQLRPLSITTDPNSYAEGSALITIGGTKVLCTATVEKNTPKWLDSKNQGWLTAEYSMLPRATHTRIKREKALSGARSQEISRLIARSLRSCIDLKAIPGKQIFVDCDVLQADGGTRTAAITGGFVALALALNFIHQKGEISHIPLNFYIAAVSIGIDKEDILLDLDYQEDSRIAVDMNFVMNNRNAFIEIQGTAEKKDFSFEQLQKMSELAQSTSMELFEKQKSIIGDFFPLDKA